MKGMAVHCRVLFLQHWLAAVCREVMLSLSALHRVKGMLPWLLLLLHSGLQCLSGLLHKIRGKEGIPSTHRVCSA